MNYNGSVEHNGHQYHYQPINPENPAQGVRVRCFYNKGARKIELKEQDIKINIPINILEECYNAAMKMYCELQERGIKPIMHLMDWNGNCHVAREAEFISDEIIRDRYTNQLWLISDSRLLNYPLLKK